MCTALRTLKTCLHLHKQLGQARRLKAQLIQVRVYILLHSRCRTSCRDLLHITCRCIGDHKDLRCYSENMRHEEGFLTAEAGNASRRSGIDYVSHQRQQPGERELGHEMMDDGVASPHSGMPATVPVMLIVPPAAVQAVQYSVLGALLLLAGFHALFFRGHKYTAPGCQHEAQHAAKLDKSLLVGIQQLRYEQRLLQADRDRMLGTGFSQVGDALVPQGITMLGTRAAIHDSSPAVVLSAICSSGTAL